MSPLECFFYIDLEIHKNPYLPGNTLNITLFVLTKWKVKSKYDEISQAETASMKTVVRTDERILSSDIFDRDRQPRQAA